mmetsp:Transcript_92813/g.271683  ORF Transcript_92813/g.271683 Transcript_92813/m.271683 type:complete len:121 (-) Transcript_92813:7-369(-)
MLAFKGSLALRATVEVLLTPVNLQAVLGVDASVLVRLSAPVLPLRSLSLRELNELEPLIDCLKAPEEGLLMGSVSEGTLNRRVFTKYWPPASSLVLTSTGSACMPLQMVILAIWHTLEPP